MDDEPLDDPWTNAFKKVEALADELVAADADATFGDLITACRDAGVPFAEDMVEFFAPKFGILERDLAEVDAICRRLSKESATWNPDTLLDPCARDGWLLMKIEGGHNRVGIVQRERDLSDARIISQHFGHGDHDFTWVHEDALRYLREWDSRFDAIVSALPRRVASEEPERMFQGGCEVIDFRPHLILLESARRLNADGRAFFTTSFDFFSRPQGVFACLEQFGLGVVAFESMEISDLSDLIGGPAKFAAEQRCFIEVVLRNPGGTYVEGDLIELGNVRSSDIYFAEVALRNEARKLDARVVVIGDVACSFAGATERQFGLAATNSTIFIPSYRPTSSDAVSEYARLPRDVKGWQRVELDQRAVTKEWLIQFLNSPIGRKSRMLARDVASMRVIVPPLQYQRSASPPFAVSDDESRVVGDPEDMWRRIETNMADVVFAVLSREFRGKWWVELQEPIRIECAKRHEAEKCAFPKEAYLDFIHLKSIIEDHWNIFAPLFSSVGLPSNRSQSLAFMNVVNQLRRLLAHPLKRHVAKREFSDAELQELSKADDIATRLLEKVRELHAIG